jgi:nitroreductase
MTLIADDLSGLMRAHRSIRNYKDEGIDPTLIDRVLVEALQGSSSSGNLNLVSVIRTCDVQRKQRLCELHFDQPMVLQAPLVLTFCAASHRTRQWLAQRGARLGFADFISSHGGLRRHHPGADRRIGAGEPRPGHLLHGHDAALDEGDRRISGMSGPLPAGHQLGRRLAGRNAGPARPPAGHGLDPR